MCENCSCNNNVVTHDFNKDLIDRVRAAISATGETDSADGLVYAICSILGVRNPFLIDVTKDVEFLTTVIDSLEDYIASISYEIDVINEIVADFEDYRDGYNSTSYDSIVARMRERVGLSEYAGNAAEDIARSML